MGPHSSEDTSLRAPIPCCLPPPREVSPKRGLEPCGQAWRNAVAAGDAALPFCCLPQSDSCLHSLPPQSGVWGAGLKARKEREENMPF